MARKKIEYDFRSDLDRELLGLEMCVHRKKSGISKKSMLDDHGINAHIINSIEKGKEVRLSQLLDYCDVIGYKVVVCVKEK